MVRRVSKYTMGVIIAVAVSLFVLGLAIMSVAYLTAYIGNLK